MTRWVVKDTRDTDGTPYLAALGWAASRKDAARFDSKASAWAALANWNRANVSPVWAVPIRLAPRKKPTHAAELANCRSALIRIRHLLRLNQLANAGQPIIVRTAWVLANAIFDQETECTNVVLPEWKP